MGTIYSVGFYDCKEYRDLDKFYTLLQEVENREDALKFSDEIKRDSFRAGLLVSFMGKHMGHKCVVFSEHDEEIHEYFDPDWEFTNEEDFWTD